MAGLPYISITTTKALAPEEQNQLRDCALNAAALLHKKREAVMVCLTNGQYQHKGDGDNQCAFCDVRIYGAATRDACDAFSAALSADVARIAQTDPGCVYLNLSEMTLCYTDGCAPPAK